MSGAVPSTINSFVLSFIRIRRGNGKDASASATNHVVRNRWMVVRMSRHHMALAIAALAQAPRGCSTATRESAGVGEQVVVRAPASSGRTSSRRSSTAASSLHSRAQPRARPRRRCETRRVEGLVVGD